MSMKNSNDTIGNRTRDLPACSAVPQSSRAVICTDGSTERLSLEIMARDGNCENFQLKLQRSVSNKVTCVACRRLELIGLQWDYEYTDRSAVWCFRLHED
jgi:hypothetical protein